MSARVMMLPTFVLAVLLAVAAPRAEAAFWTTPDPVVAGQPTRVVFTTGSYGGQPEVDVQVDGTQIVVVQTNLCGVDICLSARVPSQRRSHVAGA